MELVGGQAFAGAQQQGGAVGGQGHIAEAAQLAGAKAPALQHPGHGPGAALGVGEGLLQVEKAPALGQRGQPGLNGVPHGLPHGVVFSKGLGVQLRIAAAQVQAAAAIGQGGGPQGAEKAQLGPQAAEQLQRIVVIKAEGFIPGHGNAAACGSKPLPGQRGGRQGRGAGGQGQQPVQIGALLQRVRQFVQLGLQFGDFLGGHQPQMAAGKICPLHLGQAAEHRQPGFPDEGRGQRLGQHGAAAVQKQAPDLAGGAEGEQPLHLGGQRQAGRAGPKHQHHRGVGGPGQVPGAGRVGAAAQTVVVAHGPLQHGGAAPGAVGRQQGTGLCLAAEEQVQIVGGHSKHLPVDHGVEVIRPGLKGRGGQAAPGHGAEKRTGDGGFAAAAGQRGEHQAAHSAPPLMRYTGFWAIIRCSPPAGRLRLTEIWLT